MTDELQDTREWQMPPPRRRSRIAWTGLAVAVVVVGLGGGWLIGALSAHFTKVQAAPQALGIYASQTTSPAPSTALTVVTTPQTPAAVTKVNTVKITATRVSHAPIVVLTVTSSAKPTATTVTETSCATPSDSPSSSPDTSSPSESPETDSMKHGETRRTCGT